jgi:hypothetical protein
LFFLYYRSFFYTAEYMFMQGQFRPVTGPARVLLLGFLLMVLAALAGYTAQLASFLTNKGLVCALPVCVAQCICAFSSAF